MNRNVLFTLILALFYSCFSLINHQLFAGTTGKISGRLIDMATGDPLPGANVVIEGTTLGAATGTDGFYSILNTPPGVYTLKAMMMGYNDARMENVRVHIDLTTKIDFEMSSTVLESGETVTVVAERPLVQRDMTYSLSSVSADEIEALPVQSIDDVMELQAGIVESGGLHIRGGRTGEVAFWVDGVATTDVFSGGRGVRVENSAVQELQVVSGTYNAEYGQAMSGVINIITKEGGVEYKGEIKAYVGDYISNDDLYDVWKSVESVYDSTTDETTINESKENPLEKLNKILNGEFSFSGPVPFTNDKLTFFMNGRYFSDEGYLYGREWFLPSGVGGDSSLVPMNPYEQLSGQVKLTYKINSNMKVSYNYFQNSYKRERTYDRLYKYVPGGIQQQIGGGQTHIFSFNHTLSPNTFYEVRVNKFYNEYEQYVHEDVNARPNWLALVAEDTLTGTPEQLLDLSNPNDAAILEQAKRDGIGYQFLVDPDNPYGYVHPDSSNDPASYSYYRAGNNMNQQYRNTSYWLGKFDITSQINPMHQLKFGTELRFYELNYDDFQLQPKRADGVDEAIVPFVPEVPSISNIFHDKYNRTPKEFSAYLQDKMELHDINFNIGLRFDYFDANSVVPVDPTDPNIYAPFKEEHIYKNWIKPENDLVGEDWDNYVATFEEFTLAERREFMHKKVDPKLKLSPRLAIAYPITDRGVIHFSYGHFFQIPEFRYLYDSPDFKLTSGGGRSIVGNADLNPQRTTQYEIGLQQQLTENMGFDFTLFYRDIRDWVGTSPIIETDRPSVGYSIYENKDYSNVRGITLKLEKRFSNNFMYRVDYTFQIAEGTYSNPNDAFNSIQNDEEPRLALIPLDWDQNHTLNGQFMYKYKSWTASFIGKLWSGRPYTPSFAKGTRIGGSTFNGLVANSARRPTVTGIDFHLNKQFKVAGSSVNCFLYVYNLLDQRGERTVYGDTGSAEYTTYPKADETPYDPNRISTMEDYIKRPEWYISPREVQIGLSVGL